jgi:sulfoxide reductase heme-binding subunit YedZ
VAASGDQRRRLLRHHLPLAVASVGAFLLLMSLPLFDPQAYPRSDMTGGPLPQPIGESRPMSHSAEPTPSIGHGGSETPAPGHGAGQTPPAAHGGGQAPPTGHSGAQSQAGDAGPSPGAIQDRFTKARLTTATGYVATGLLALTLVIGPANLLLRRRNPVSSYLRRDVGAWTAVFSVVHVILGLQVHGSGQLSGSLGYFLAPDGSLLLNSFGLGNWTGLAATVIVVGLLAISSDLALRKLKAGRWKWLQRLNYALFALVIAHAFFYGALLRVTSPFTLLLGLSVIAVFVGQALGFSLWRRSSARRSEALSFNQGANQ